MSTDLTKAAHLLKEEGYTCVLCQGDTVLTSRERGVKPLLTWLDSGEDLTGYSAADKVVGKAAAFLYVLLGIRSVHVLVLSRPALSVFERHHIDVSYELLVDGIQNRTNTGPCPMESAVLKIDESKTALQAIRQTLEHLRTMQ